LLASDDAEQPVEQSPRPALGALLAAVAEVPHSLAVGERDGGFPGERPEAGLPP